MDFLTRTVTLRLSLSWLQVAHSTNGTKHPNVGATATSVGDFTTLLLDINPTYTLTGYPNVWTQFTVTVSGLGSPTTGRLAFRYFVENGGPTGANSDYIGIDTVQYTCNQPPTPTPTPTPTPISISGAISYCANPVPDPVPNGDAHSNWECVRLDAFRRLRQLHVFISCPWWHLYRDAEQGRTGARLHGHQHRGCTYHQRHFACQWNSPLGVN